MALSEVANDIGREVLTHAGFLLPMCCAAVPSARCWSR
jgi:hypothetical protein